MLINDTYPYIFLISAIGTYYLAVIFHEFGHYVSGFIIGYKPKMNFDKLKFPCSVILYSHNFNEYCLKITSISGILIGLIPIFIFYEIFYVSKTLLFLIIMSTLLCGYMAACSQDIKDIIYKRIKQRKLSEFIN